MTDPLPPEMQAKLDAWINSIRGLARQHGVAHRPAIGRAVKDLRLATSKPVILEVVVRSSVESCAEAGIPKDELISVRTLIFG